MLNDGALRFTVKDGRSFDSLVPTRHAAESVRPNEDITRGNWSQLVSDLAERGIAITPKTAVTRWGGERMDYDLAVGVLLHKAHRAAQASAVSAEMQRPAH